MASAFRRSSGSSRHRCRHACPPNSQARIGRGRRRGRSDTRRLRRLRQFLIVGLDPEVGCGRRHLDGRLVLGLAAGGGAGALSADAKSAATGDIPDNQVFLTFNNTADGWSMKYPGGLDPDGLARERHLLATRTTSFTCWSAAARPRPSASVAAQLQALKSSRPSLTFTAPTALTLPSGAAVKATYTTRSAPNPVTGKRVTLIVDRYALCTTGRVSRPSISARPRASTTSTRTG